MMHLARCAVLAAVLLTVAPPAPATACGYDMVPADSFGMIHPGSFDVAVALRQAVEAGLIEAPVAAPAAQGQAGYWAAVRRLDRLLAVLAASPAAATLPPTSLVFVDSSLWSRFTFVAGDLRLQVHALGTEPGDAVLLTGESALAAVLDGRLAVAAALDRGLFLLAGEPAAVTALRALLLQALADPGAAAVAGQPKLRLFSGD